MSRDIGHTLGRAVRTAGRQQLRACQLRTAVREHGGQPAGLSGRGLRIRWAMVEFVVESNDDRAATEASWLRYSFGADASVDPAERFEVDGSRLKSVV